MVSENKIYNYIAYFTQIIGLIISIIIFLFLFNLIEFESKYTAVNLGFITFGCSEIYRKLHTIPITKAISYYWKYKIKKQDKNNNTSQDYKK